MYTTVFIVQILQNASQIELLYAQHFKPCPSFDIILLIVQTNYKIVIN